MICTTLVPGVGWPSRYDPTATLGVQDKVACYVQTHPGCVVSEVRTNAGVTESQANHALARLRPKLTLVKDTVKPADTRYYAIRYYWIGGLQ